MASTPYGTRSAAVPQLQVHLLEDGPPAVTSQLARELADVVERVLGSLRIRISALVSEYSEGDWKAAGEHRTLSRRATHD